MKDMEYVLIKVETMLLCNVNNVLTMVETF